MWNLTVELEKKNPPSFCPAGDYNKRHPSVKLSNVITAWAWRKPRKTHHPQNSLVLDCWQICYWIISSFLLFSPKCHHVLAWISLLIFIHPDSDFMLLHVCHFTFNQASLKKNGRGGAPAFKQQTHIHFHSNWLVSPCSRTKMVPQVTHITMLLFCWLSLFDWNYLSTSCLCLQLFVHSFDLLYVIMQKRTFNIFFILFSDISSQGNRIFVGILLFVCLFVFPFYTFFTLALWTTTHIQLHQAASVPSALAVSSVTTRPQFACLSACLFLLFYFSCLTPWQFNVWQVWRVHQINVCRRLCRLVPSGLLLRQMVLSVAQI